MKIENSVVSFYGSRAYLKKAEESENLRTWVGDDRPDFEGAGDTLERQAASVADNVELSLRSESGRATSATDDPQKSGPAVGGEDLRTLIIEQLLETLTGRKMKITLPGDMQTAWSGSAASNGAAQAGGSPGRQAQGWGLEYDYQGSEYESEKTEFSASGTIWTTDGRRIDFFAEMSMSREFLAERNITLREGDGVKIDPLVVNFGGGAATLTETKFDFDLDSDGVEERISFLAPGAGFLALDSNGNGAIDDGSELFGPGTGNGFTELSAFDEDGNGWIDEGDPVFGDLRIWVKDPEGSDILTTLKEKGIGAVCLGRVSTPFSINAKDNSSLGSAKESGVYLNEDGSAGTVQEIELTT